MNNSKIIIGAMILAFLAGGIFAVDFFSHQRAAGTYSDTDPAYNRVYWRQEITDRGPAKTYASFKEKNAKAPTLRQHFAAHIVGELLYEKLGIPGVALCDASFGFGCYHGFFGTAIASGGTILVPKLDAACVNAYSALGTGCQHGLGHGILEYVGYTRLTDALKLCKMTTQLVPLLGCTSGVFMEYNTPLVSNDTGATPAPRTLDLTNPHAPCPSVPPDNRASCYFELGQWYRTQVSDYAKLDSLCSTLSGSDRTHCFLGIGASIAPMEGYVVSNALAHCDSFGSRDALSCRAGISWSFFEVPEHRAHASEACALPDRTQEKACTTLADLTQGLDSSQQ